LVLLTLKRVEFRSSATARHALPGLIRGPSRASQALFAENRPRMPGSSLDKHGHDRK
jgi:hypothetical protein